MNHREKKDAEIIRKALEGSETDEKSLINIAGKRTHKERMKIRQSYKALFQKDLMSVFISDLSADFKIIMLALFTDPVEYDADCIYRAIKDSDEETLIEIFVSRPGWYLNKIKDLYLEKYKKDLEEHLRGDSSDDLRRLLVLLIQGKRSSNKNPDKEKCQKFAKDLYESGEKKLGIDEELFNKIFVLSSPYELIEISREYHKLSEKLLTTAIDGEFSGNIKKLLKSTLYANISPSEYFATRIHDSIDGFGENKNALTRIIVTRVEIDLPKIKEYYNKLYGKDMVENIKERLSGNYLNLLIAICNLA